jgi:hypothetical protein
VFYSIPYEEGWSATVNGKPAEIEKVNIGFMAVKVPAGENNVVRFDYETPGLKLGVIVSIISVLLFACYLLGWKLYKREHTEEFDRLPALIGGDEFEEIPGKIDIADLDALNAALENISVEAKKPDEAGNAPDGDDEFKLDDGFRVRAPEPEAPTAQDGVPPAAPPAPGPEPEWRLFHRPAPEPEQNTNPDSGPEQNQSPNPNPAPDQNQDTES